jgi:hypothetical protein
MKFKIKASGFRSHAELEFKALGYQPIQETPPDDPNRWIQENVYELLEVFGKQGHSGSSAPFCIAYFETLAKFEPLSPLTGEAWEWEDVSEMSGQPMWQNKRCSHVFKDESGAYDINGKIFIEPDGICFTNRESSVPVTFPYKPTTEYVDVPRTASVVKELPKGGIRALARLRNNSNSAYRIIVVEK